MLDKIWGRGRVFATRDACSYLFQGYTAFGIFPTRKYRRLYYLYAFLIYIMVCIITPVVFNMSYILESTNMDVSQLLTSLQAGMNVWGVPAKVITVGVSLRRLRGAESLMHKLDERCQSAEELARVRQLVMTGNRVVLFFSLFYGVYGVSTFVAAIFRQEAAYSMHLFFIDYRNSTMEYYGQIALEIAVIFIIIAHQVLNDCYPVIYIYILRTHMQLLVKRVRRLGVDPEKNSQANYKDLVKCIMDHKTMLQLHDEISRVVSITVFVQFLITAMILGTTLINILIFADTPGQIAATFYFLAVLMQISPTCYQATCLIEDNAQLPRAIFECNWMDQDARFRKLLIFFMQRAQKNITYMAMKLFPITLDTSISIAKFSFSLYTLIKEMDFGKSFKK